MTVIIVVEYYRLAEAALHLGVDRTTLSRWLKSGKMEAIAVGRERLFLKSEIDLLSDLLGEQRAHRKVKE